MVWQLLKLDEDSKKMIGAIMPAGFHSINSSIDSPYLFNIDPTEFTHAYMLMGAQPTRFGYDLSLYLSTINTYFQRHGKQKTICIENASQDAKKRLSEDLGVAMAAIFMVKAANVEWTSISQIPVNNKLAKKRPDFEGFTNTGKRYLFEAKGTTNSGQVEKALVKAIEQVKSYPEDAEQKLAIVSFFSSDDRLFDSATFVVDPPLPSIVPPDEDTSRLLHYEKILQFSGFVQSAFEYIKSLEKYLKSQKEQEEKGVLALMAAEEYRLDLLTNSIDIEMEKSEKHQINGREFYGKEYREIVDGKNYRLFMGVDVRVFDKIKQLDASDMELEKPQSLDDNSSYFTDGTIMRITLD